MHIGLGQRKAWNGFLAGVLTAAMLAGTVPAQVLAAETDGYREDAAGPEILENTDMSVCDMGEASDDEDEIQYFGGGKGTEEEPFLIYTYAHLDEMHEHGGFCYFELMDDIRANPNPDDRTNEFRGGVKCRVFHGNGHTISNLCITGSDNLSLFSYVTELVDDLTLENVRVYNESEKSNTRIASLAYVAKQVVNCHLTGLAEFMNTARTKVEKAGGLCLEAGKMENCSMDARLVVYGIDTVSGIASEGRTVRNCSLGPTASITPEFVNGEYTSGSLKTVIGIAGGADVYKDYGSEYENLVEGCFTSEGAVLYADNEACGISHSHERILNCKNEAELTAYKSVCGITKYASHVVNCENSGIFLGKGKFCGIAEQLNGDGILKNCRNTADLNYKNGIVDDAAEASGIVWLGMGLICDTVNEGKIGGMYASGIVGKLDHGSVEKCINRGDIIATTEASGIASHLGLGGMSADNQCLVTYCSNSGKIEAKEAAGIAYDVETGVKIICCANHGDIIWHKAPKTRGTCAGIAAKVVSTDTDGNGAGIEINDCYNTGGIQAEGTDYDKRLGGIVADLNPSNGITNIERCYNAGKIEGSDIDHIGALVSYMDFSIHEDGVVSLKDCYYLDRGQKGYTSVGEAKHLSFQASSCTEEQMGNPATFRDWDFQTIWTMGSGSYTYPMLQSEFSQIYEITLDAKGGSVQGKELTTVRTNGNGKLISPPRAVWKGKRFEGWYSAPENGDRITADWQFREDTTIYANWTPYDPADRVEITVVEPANGTKGFRWYEEDNTYGVDVDYQLSFRVADTVTAINNQEGEIRIIDYETDEEAYHSGESAKFDFRTMADGSTLVTMKGGFPDFSAGFADYREFYLKPGRQYYVMIDDSLLQFEDADRYAVMDDKDSWSFRTSVSAKPRYRDESSETDTLLSYEFDFDELDFSRPSTDFNQPLSTFAYGVALSAFESYLGGYGDGSRNFREFMGRLGFENIEANDNYRKKPDADSIGVCAASKKLSEPGYTLIVLGIRGAGYEAEWAGNLKVGKDYVHQGFTEAADQAVEYFKEYIRGENVYDAATGEYRNREPITGKLKVIVTGYSRAAATANITAHMLQASGTLFPVSDLVTLNAKDLYGFCFEPPATIRVDEKDKGDRNLYDRLKEEGNIYNFINPKDFVPMLPSPEWGYLRYGKDYYYPSSVSNKAAYRQSYPAFINNLNQIVTCDTYMGQPVLSYVYNESRFNPTVHEGLAQEEWIRELLDSFSTYINLDEYGRYLQDTVCDALDQGLDFDHFGEVFKSSIVNADSDIPEQLAFLMVILYFLQKNVPASDYKLFLSGYTTKTGLNGIKATIDKGLAKAEDYLQLLPGMDDSNPAKFITFLGHAEIGALNLYMTFRPTGSVPKEFLQLYWSQHTVSGDNGSLLEQEHEPLVNFAWHITCNKKGWEEWYSDGSMRYIKVNCPVNVRLYDEADGKLAAEILNDKETELSDSPVTAYVDENGQKVFIVPTDGNYRVDIEATGDGELNYSILERSASRGYTRRIDYLDIPIRTNDRLTGEVGEWTTGDAVYRLLKGDEPLTGQESNEIPRYQVDLRMDESQKNLGMLQGSGIYMGNEFVMARAVPEEGSVFTGWYDPAGNKVCEDSEYRFRVERDCTLTARFTVIDGVRAEMDDAVPWTGKPVKPQVTLYEGARELVPGRDYTVSYKNNRNAYAYSDEDYEKYEEAVRAGQKNPKIPAHDGGIGFDPKKAPQAVVRMKGDYSGSKALYFRILPTDITGDSFDADDLAVMYTGKKKLPVPVLLQDGKKLKYGKDYYVPEIDAVKADAGAFAGSATEDTVYTLSLTGKGNYSGTRSITYTVYGNTKAGSSVTRILMDSVSVPSIPAQDYRTDGETITADKLADKKGNPLGFTVTCKNGRNTLTLTEGEDYEIEYRNNRESGTATMLLKGLEREDNPSGVSFVGTKRVSFTIRGNFSGIRFESWTPEYWYTGKPVMPTGYRLTCQGRMLTEGTDYTVEAASDNTETGTASVLFTGIGAYSGSVKKTFRIKKEWLGDGDAHNIRISFETGCCPYVKNKVKYSPEIRWTRETAGGEVTTVLREGMDYTVKYENTRNIQPGYVSSANRIVTGTVNGRGNFSGSFRFRVDITPGDLTDPGVDAYAPDGYLFMGGGIHPSSPVIHDAGGAILKSGTDYEVLQHELVGTWDEKNNCVIYCDPSEIRTVTTGSGSAQIGSVIRVTVRGKGNYDPEKELSMEYRILMEGRDISRAKFTLKKSVPYNGGAVKLAESDILSAQLMNGTELTYGVQYAIDEDGYKNNLKRGKAQVTFVGRGSYGGRKTENFNIGVRSLAEGVWLGIVGRSW